IGDELGAAKLCVVIARMIAATARTIPKTYASLAGSGFGAMCPLLAPDRCRPCRTLRGESGAMCELRHTSAVVQKMQGGQKPHGSSAYLHVGVKKAPTIKRPGQVKA